jgi:hypothetical protein
VLNAYYRLQLVNLKDFAIYWDSKENIVEQNKEKSEVFRAFKELIENQADSLTFCKIIRPPILKMEYFVILTRLVNCAVLRPISSTAKIRFTPNPEKLSPPFTKPKFFVEIISDDMSLSKGVIFLLLF